MQRYKILHRPYYHFSATVNRDSERIPRGLPRGGFNTRLPIGRRTGVYCFPI